VKPDGNALAPGDRLAASAASFAQGAFLLFPSVDRNLMAGWT